MDKFWRKSSCMPISHSAGALDSGPFPSLPGACKIHCPGLPWRGTRFRPFLSSPGACKIHCPFLLRGIQFRAPPFFTRGMQNSLPFPPQGHSIQGPSLLYQGHAKFTALSSSEAFNSGLFPSFPGAWFSLPFHLQGPLFPAHKKV
jgi:hypothetical protein